MILDSSAILCIARREPRIDEVFSKLARASQVAIGAPTLAEAGIVLSARMKLDGRAFLDRFVLDFDVETIHFGAAHWREAVAAFRRYGKGRHEAALNYGDCLTYAVAKLAGEPRLFTGDDFSRTDLQAA